MLAVISLTLLALASSYEASLDHFTQWAFDHQKFYEDDTELALRQSVWLDNALYVKELNEKHAGRTTFKLNRFGDLTHDEYKATLSPLSTESITKATKDMIAMDLPPWVSVPDSFDWREKGVVTPIKDQGSCGSCYSFSTTGAIEGAWAIKTGELVSLSEQQIMDCTWDYNNYGCQGGMYDRAFYYIMQNGGIDTEASYPYTMRESHTCKFNSETVAAKVTNFYYVKQQNEDALKLVIAIKGPVSVAIDASHRSFQFYHTGVYDEPDCVSTNLDHAVLAVGYGTENDMDYFLVKNSWGTAWGDAGYVKMRRNAGNQCGIATIGSFPEC